MNLGIENEDQSLEAEVSLAKQGDRDAFSNIVTNLNRRLLAICKSKCKGHPDYEDVASEVWHEVWKRLPKFDGMTCDDVMRLACSIARVRNRTKKIGERS